MKFDSILFPIDFSDSCNALKSDVECLARKFDSNVTLLHIFEIPAAWYGMGDAAVPNGEWIKGVMDDAQKRLDAFAIDLPSVKVHRVLAEGRPAAEIESWCKKHEVDMVAMATHGHGALDGLVMGSVTAKVLHNVNVPLFVRPAGVAADGSRAEWSGTFRIVCGVGLEEETKAVLIRAKELAEWFDAEVTLVHSVPAEEARPNKYFDQEVHDVLRGLAAQQIAKYQDAAGTAFETVISDAAIGTALAKVANDKKARLVLIGRGHSRRFLGRFRTHALELLSHASCPVISWSEEEVHIRREPELVAAGYASL